jgi:hypothetical protein
MMIKKNKYGVIENMKLGKEMMEDILKRSATRYLSYKEDLGRLELQMLSEIEVVRPGEPSLDGNEWNPPVEDKDGNPIIQQFGPNKGKVMEPWTKVEVKVKVLNCSGDKSLADGSEKFFRLGGENSKLVGEFVKIITNEEITPDKFVGTKWSIYGEKTPFWKYQVEYLGREDVGETISKKAETKAKVEHNIDGAIVDALRVKKDQTKGSLQKVDLITSLSIVTHIKASDIEKMWNDLIKAKLIEEKDGKVFIA